MVINQNLQKYIDEKKNIHKFIFFGAALGFQIEQMSEQYDSKVYLICEPNLELFRLSLLTVSYKAISKKTDILFSINAAPLIKQLQSAVSLQSFITFPYHRQFMATKRPLEYMNNHFNNNAKS